MLPLDRHDVEAADALYRLEALDGFDGEGDAFVCLLVLGRAASV